MTATPPAGIQDAARHLAENRTGEAVAVLERLVEEFPSYVTAHVLLAKAYEAHGHVAEALDAWHHAYFLMPGSPLVLRERARLLRAEPETLTVSRRSEPTSSEAATDTEVSTVAETSTITERPAGAGTSPTIIDEVDNLDGLIEQLENAPRIRPNAEFEDDGIDWVDEDEKEVVSETLARIYESQGEHQAAARTYEQLADLHPERADELRTKATELRRLTEGSST